MREITQTTVTSQISATPIDTASDKASTKASTRAASSRIRYSGNDIMRIRNALMSAKLDMDDKRFSMNGVIHVVQEEIESLMQSHNCSYAELARLFASNGCPVSERTLKDYLARARKDAREGRTGYSRVRQLIIESAESEPAVSAGASGASEASELKPAKPVETAESGIAGAGQADPVSTTEDCIPDASAPVSQEEPCAPPESPDTDFMRTPDCDYLERSVARAMDANEAADRKRQHIQAVYDARKRRKKARLSKKKVQAA